MYPTCFSQLGSPHFGRNILLVNSSGDGKTHSIAFIVYGNTVRSHPSLTGVSYYCGGGVMRAAMPPHHKAIYTSLLGDSQDTVVNMA